MRELEHEFADELVVIGVHSAKFPAEKVSANLRAAVQRLELHHPVVNDADFAVWQGYAVRAWPTLMFVDPLGRVFGKHEGEFPLEPVRDLLTDAIARFDREGQIDRRPLPLAPLPEPTGPLRYPSKVLADADRGRLFVADTGHHRVLVTDLNGRVTGVLGAGEAGLEDGPAEAARFRAPQGLALDSTGQILYVADTENHAIRAVDLADGRVGTIAGTGEQTYQRRGGPARETALSSPWDLALIGEQLWIAMAGTHQLWALDIPAGRVEPAAGTGAESIHDGPLAEATFAQPSGLTELDGVLYVADSETSAIRRVDPAADRVRRLIGRGLFDFGDADGTGDQARLQHVLGVSVIRENGGGAVYVADAYNHRIKRLDPATRTIVSRFGSGEPGMEDGVGSQARFWEPGGLSVAGRRIYVADTNNHAIRVCDLEDEMVTTIEVSGA